jgi:peptide/nickel transport system permease protein
MPDKDRDPDEIERIPAAGQPGAVETLTEGTADLEVTEAETGGLRRSEVVLTTRQLSWRRFKRHKMAVISAVVLLVLILATILAGFLSSYNYSQQDFKATLEGPSAKHFLGTDELGRDEFTRVLYGGRISLLVGFSVALSAGIVGAVVGAAAGFYGRWIDNILMRVTDLFLSIPFLVILIIAATALGGSVLDIVVILSLFFWMPDARIVRGVFLSMKEKEFVEAARASGASNRRIMYYHMLPNAMGPIIVNATLSVAAAILTESALSFLGFGVQPPTPTWGTLLQKSREYVTQAPGLVWFPGLMILITVLAVNFLGDGLRDALDPHQRLVGKV